jgi:hypothetical protein
LTVPEKVAVAVPNTDTASIVMLAASVLNETIPPEVVPTAFVALSW